MFDCNLKHENKSLDKFCYWLSDILPEIEFGEVVAFMNDEYLTANGQEEKRRKKSYGYERN